MTTIIEYFNTDFSRCPSQHKPWLMRDKHGKELSPITARILQDFDANTKFWSFYLPAGVNIHSYVNCIFQTPETKKCILGPEGDTFEVTMGFVTGTERMSSTTLLFTNRIFLYIDALLTDTERNHIKLQGEDAGFFVVVRDWAYVKTMLEQGKPLAFISHDSRDKDDLVRELAINMEKLMCPVWYDEYSLKVGDSLRQSIEKGLKETKNCILILSPNFLSNDGWSKAEFDSVYTREIIENKNVMLPIWHNVTQKQVYDYSPRLADKFALQSSIGVEELSKQLARKVKQTGT